VRPLGATGPLPAILYVHGGGWVLGNAGTHDRLVRELAVGADAAVAFVEYDRSPETRYPVAIVRTVGQVPREHPRRGAHRLPRNVRRQ
jgi:acetyl esterase